MGHVFQKDLVSMSLNRHLLHQAHLASITADQSGNPLARLIELQYLYPHRSLGYALTLLARDRDIPREVIGAAVHDASLDRQTLLGRLTHEQLTRLSQSMLAAGHTLLR